VHSAASRADHRPPRRLAHGGAGIIGDPGADERRSQDRHLRMILSEYVEHHYHTERNHQGLSNELLTPLPANTDAGAAIHCRERLGGILRYYFRGAA
jgi:hypothetical protein